MNVSSFLHGLQPRTAVPAMAHATPVAAPGMAAVPAVAMAARLGTLVERKGRMSGFDEICTRKAELSSLRGTQLQTIES